MCDLKTLGIKRYHCSVLFSPTPLYFIYPSQLTLKGADTAKPKERFCYFPSESKCLHIPVVMKPMQIEQVEISG